MRLLLGREFHLEDVLRLWDAIFAYGQGLVLVDYIIVAMLMFIRESSMLKAFFSSMHSTTNRLFHVDPVLNKEYTACLQRLFKYPPVEDVSGFVTKALALMNPKTAKLNKSTDAKDLQSTVRPCQIAQRRIRCNCSHQASILPQVTVDSPLFKANETVSTASAQDSDTPVHASPLEPKLRKKEQEKKETKERKEKTSSLPRGSITASLKHLIPDANPLKHAKVLQNLSSLCRNARIMNP